MALKLDNNLLEELGLGALPEQEKQLLLRQIYEKLEMNVGVRLADQMSNEQLDEFEKFVDANDDKGAFQWLESNFPNYKDVVNQEFEKLKAEIRQYAPQMLAVAQQPPQAPQPGQAAPLGGQPPMPPQPGGGPDPQQQQYVAPMGGQAPQQYQQPPAPAGPSPYQQPAYGPQPGQYAPDPGQPMPPQPGQYGQPQQQPQPGQYQQPGYPQPGQNGAGQQPFQPGQYGPPQPPANPGQ
jgi:hypothetical protein